ncbi:zinc-dependent metalloprotease [Corallococcus sp. CA053C]|uniref:zinc-dependent metalloprotease n=1 Tax=Corallococcus sp. CA053C TaxID=2316732 RepID=UPI001315AD8C|nr:zinc-dependent metalloprotease [Corallococcus sp. CA053C]
MLGRTWSSRRRWWGAASLMVMLTGGGCDTAEPVTETEAPEASLAVSLEDAFVAVPRATSTEQRQQVEQQLSGIVTDAGTHFYLAIKRSELDQKWFLSAFLKQVHPGGALSGAGKSLGTRVVSFQEQNGRLFVLDVDGRKKYSDVFDPQVLVEAYPVVTDYGPFNRLRNADQYVLIDPSAGLNRFGVVGDSLSYSTRFQTELSFAQRFHAITDGIAFEQVFTGYSELPDPFASEFLEPNGYRTSGTVGLALRRYKEGPGYTPTAMPAQTLYFPGAESFINNAGGWTDTPAMKWNIHPGMKPIPWVITPTVLTLQADPRFQAYDLVGAIKRGVEGWNQAFGFKVLEATVGGPELDFADDDKNVLIFDPDEFMPIAFANFRINPITSEMRGASVYLPASWLVLGDENFESDPGAFAAARARTLPPARISWAGMKAEPLCDLNVLERFGDPDSSLASSRTAVTPQTKKQKVEAYLTHVVLHEIGHTLGLRHNFAGSLVYDGTPTGLRSSSVMDYVLEEDSILDGGVPGPYDVQAVRYLYGLDAQLPTWEFCTDQDRITDPRCAAYDRTNDPFSFTLADFNGYAQSFLTTASVSVRLNNTLNSRTNLVLGFVRAGTEQVRAYQDILASVRPPLVVPPGAPAVYASRADELARRVLTRLYLDPVTSRGTFTANAPTTPQFTAPVLADVRGILLNVDGVRGYAARRAMVDILKQFQTLPAYSVLREARDTLTAQLTSLTGDERLQSEDLLARITSALSPYYR